MTTDAHTRASYNYFKVTELPSSLSASFTRLVCLNAEHELCWYSDHGTLYAVWRRADEPQMLSSPARNIYLLLLLFGVV